MGFKVPWVKVWLDPQTDLPVQLHSVVLDGRMAWTFTDFRWNEPFDEELMQLVRAQGIRICEIARRAENAGGHFHAICRPRQGRLD